MNYYSDDIIKDIIDNSEIENILENIEEFKDDAKMMFYYFSFLLFFKISLFSLPA